MRNWGCKWSILQLSPICLLLFYPTGKHQWGLQILLPIFHRPILFLLCGLMAPILGALFPFCPNCAYLSEKFWNSQNAGNLLTIKNAVNVRWRSLQFVQQTASSKSNFSASLSWGSHNTLHLWLIIPHYFISFQCTKNFKKYI